MMDLSKFGGADVGCFLVVKDHGALGKTLWIVLRAQTTIGGTLHGVQEEYEFTDDAVRLIRMLPSSVERRATRTPARTMTITGCERDPFAGERYSDGVSPEAAALSFRLYGRMGWANPQLRALAVSLLQQKKEGRNGGGLRCPICKERGCVRRAGPGAYQCMKCDERFILGIDAIHGLTLTLT